MMSSPFAAFRIDEHTSAEAVLRSLQALLPSRPVETGAVRTVVYDTPDGRLRRAGQLLWAETRGGATHLHRRAAGETADEQAEAPAAPDFAWNLPEPLRGRLADIVGSRRLLPVLEIERAERGLDVLDGQGKTVARVRLPEGRTRLVGGREWGSLPAVLTVEPLRGYVDEHHEVLLIVATRPGLLPAEGEPGSLDQICAALAPAAPVAAPALRGDVRADAGLAAILLGQLEVIAANHRGVIDDVDTEFLHDFRVAVRRTRSLLKQFKRVLAKDVRAHFRAEFAWLGRASNAQRDLDVFRLWLREQPSDPGLSPVIDWLEARRQVAHEQLVIELDSPRYLALVAEWRAFLEGPPVATTAPGESRPKHAAQPLRAVVARRVRRAYRRAVEQGEGLEAHSPAPELHQLRIDCKQLRYLLDTTAPLHEARQLERLVGALKRLQSALGECNDASVQRATLDGVAEELQAGPAPRAATLLALGRLQARLDERERRAREQVAGHVERLASERVRSAIQQLGESPADEAP